MKGDGFRKGGHNLVQENGIPPAPGWLILNEIIIGITMKFQRLKNQFPVKDRKEYTLGFKVERFDTQMKMLQSIS